MKRGFSIVRERSVSYSYFFVCSIWIAAVNRRSVLRVMLKFTPEFAWHDRAHGGALRWHLWVEDSDSETIYHTEVRSEELEVLH